MKPLRVAVVGAGVAGAIVAKGLAALPDVDVLCVDQADPSEMARQATALNLGPNALRVLRALDPALYADVRAASLPWRTWRMWFADGQPLFRLALSDLVDEAGIRIRWAELYRVLRAPIAATLRYRTRVDAVRDDGDGTLALTLTDATGTTARSGFDLVIAADGRFSRLREQLCGAAPTAHLPVGMFRLMFDDAGQTRIDDYEQWFNAGPARLLAYRVPGDGVYIGGSAPLASAHEIDDARKRASSLARLFAVPDGRRACDAYRYLVDAVLDQADRLHWARQQEIAIRFRALDGRVLFLGDAAHAMTTTLGQGATQSVEDAAVTVAVARAAARAGRLADVPAWTARVEALRHDRVAFVMQASRDASDTLLPGADPIAGTLAKAEPPFLATLARIFADTPDLERIARPATA
ncbi:MAG TPA: FAD-dependent monooxygenase [Candidatus Sulfotelmatobacter sp.]|nr:FAD-dependent monooxygenase [Candidatus Sulfotelmatobacter sp.]